MCVQYRGCYYEYRGGYHEYCTVGDIMSNVAGVQYHGGTESSLSSLQWTPQALYGAS